MIRTAPARTALVGLAFVASLGCGRESGSSTASPSGSPSASEGAYRGATSFPPLPKLEEIAAGTRYAEVALPATGRAARRLWVYLPRGAKGKTPVVFIGPAGSPLWFGMELGDGDRPEHLPYVRAGFAVVAYELDGPLDSQKATDAEAARAANAFRAAEHGVRNAKDAIEYALRRLPIDPKRMYVAGHSSAGTLALQVAAKEPRVAGCLAYMPVTDLEADLGPGMDELNGFSPGYAGYARRLSPHELAAEIRCPVFLYAADDDENVPATEVEAFARRVRATNPKVTYRHAANGGHYDAMVGKGIPEGIGWLGTLSGASGAR